MYIGIVIRLLWRIFVLAVGLVAAWIIYKIYPFAHEYLPVYIVVFLIYCLVAYFILPTLARLLSLVIKPDHIPLYVTTRDGLPSDPVNLAIVARDKAQLRKMMLQAGWYEADKLTIASGFKEFFSIVFNTPYPAAPVSTLYLFNRPHDIAFEIPTSSTLSARTRHHVRFWKLTEPSIARTDYNHFSFWEKRLNQFFGVKRSIWVGAATEEPRAVDFQWRTGQLTHGGSHDADAERDFIIETLAKIKSIRRVVETARGEKLQFRGQQFRTIYTTDGGLKVIELKIPRKLIHPTQ